VAPIWHRFPPARPRLLPDACAAGTLAPDGFRWAVAFGSASGMRHGFSGLAASLSASGGGRFFDAAGSVMLRSVTLPRAYLCPMV